MSDTAGFRAACLVDSDSGLILTSETREPFDLDAAAAFGAQLIRAELQVVEALGLDDSIEDIVITLERQIHLIRPLSSSPTVFLYLALDRQAASLGMGRMRLRDLEQDLSRPHSRGETFA